MVKVELRQGLRAEIKLGTVQMDMRNGIRTGLNRVAKISSQVLKQGIKNPPKTGRMYGTHRASRAGEYPANQTGTLMNSVDYEVFGYMKAEIGLKAPYARDLEEGNARMGSRPMLRKTAQVTKPQVKSYMERATTLELTRG